MPKPHKTIRQEKVSEIDIGPLVSQVVNGEASEDLETIVRAAEAYEHAFTVGQVKEFVAGVLYGLCAVDALKDAQSDFEASKKAKSKPAAKKSPAKKPSSKKKS